MLMSFLLTSFIKTAIQIGPNSNTDNLNEFSPHNFYQNCYTDNSNTDNLNFSFTFTIIRMLRKKYITVNL